MKLRQMAYSNIKHNFRKYAMYFLSLCFSVFTVYAFLGLMFNDAVELAFTSDIRYRSLLFGFGIIIAVFVFFFMLNANNSFIRARKREISMYSLFGMTNSKIGKLLFVETLMVGMSALVVGVVLGIFFSKLTAMVMLNMTIPDYAGSVAFSVSIVSVAITALIFIIFFCILGLSGLRVVNKFELVDLFKGDKVSEGNPKGSWLLLAASLALMGFGYYLACSPNVYIVVKFTLLILGTVILGTFLFFLAGLPKILSIFKKRKKNYYKAQNLISVSSFAHRVRSVGASLATIAVLSAVATTAIATGFTLYSSVDKNTYDGTGYDLRFYGNQEEAMDQIRQIIEDNGASITEEINVQRYVAYPKIEKIEIDNDMYIGQYFGDDDFYIRAYSETEFNKIIEMSKADLGKVNVGGTDNAIFITQNGLDELGDAMMGKEVKFPGKTVVVSGTMNCNFVNLGAVYTMVFSDEMFINLLDSGDISDRYKAGDLLDKAIMINYTKSLNRDLNNEITSVREKVSFFRLAYAEYSESLLIFGLVRFIGFFMGAIVILMTASMLYFKQIMAAEEERHLYNILRKIGMSEEIEKKAIVKRLLPVFMVPLVVGIIHSVFAMKTANTIIFSNLITTGNSYLTVLAFSGVMYLAYAVVYAVFYLVTKSQYVRVIRK